MGFGRVLLSLHRNGGNNIKMNDIASDSVPGYSKAIPTAKKHSQGLWRYWATVDDLGFKIVKTIGGGGLLARINEICKAAFEKAIFVYPNEHLEMCQGARVILKSKEQS